MKALSRLFLLLVAVLVMLPVHAQSDVTTTPPVLPSGPAAGAGTVAFEIQWPMRVDGENVYLAGEGLLQLLVLAPEALAVIQGAAKGDDVKAKAAQLVAIIEQSKGETADPAVVCAAQITRITQLEEQVNDIQGQVRSITTRATSCEAERTAARTAIEGLRQGIDSAANALKSAVDAIKWGEESAPAPAPSN